MQEFTHEKERGFEGSGFIDDPVKLYLNDIGSIPLLTQAQEVELGKRMGNGDESARNELVEANLKLVVSVAKKYTNRGVAVP